MKTFFRTFSAAISFAFVLLLFSCNSQAGTGTDGNFSISIKGESSVKVGSTITLSVTSNPGDAQIGSLKWSSGNTGVASVNQSGIVTGVKEGSAVITVTCDSYPDISAKKAIRVTAKDSSSGDSGDSSGSGDTSGGSSGESGSSGSDSDSSSETDGSSSDISGATIPLSGYSLVWSDEFTSCDSDSTPLSSNWGYDVGAGCSENSDGTNPNNWAWGNNELQWYSNNDPDNTYVSDGTLKIVAKKESSNDMAYTSGRLVTRGLKTFKYGYVEMSAKIPNDKGVWPAFWMLDNDIYNGEVWPGSGEIDIMETSVNLWGSDKVYGTLHCQAGYGGSPVFTEGTSLSYSDGEFHKYAVNWDDDKIDWYFDDVKVFTYTPADYNNDAWPFKDDFYIILNLAVGGNLGGTVPSDFESSTMEVDYVRVWQKDSGYTDRDGAITSENQPESSPAKTIPERAAVIFDSSAAATNAISSSDSWNGGWSSTDCTLENSKTVKQINFSSLNGENACGGWNIAEYAYSANSVLHLSVYASENFSIKPVNPNAEYAQTVSNSGTYEWLDVEIDLGSANSLSQIGFISTVQQVFWVDHVYVTEKTSGGSSSGESSDSQSGSGSEDSGSSDESSIDWSSITWADNGSSNSSYTGKFKFYAVDGEGSLVNIQLPGFATEAGLYVTFNSAPSAISLDSTAYTVQGAGVLLHCSAFTAKETIFTVTVNSTAYKCAVYYADGTE